MRYADYPGTVEYFDIYSPVLSSVYSQVIWTTFPSISLPDEIVKRFAGGKPMWSMGEAFTCSCLGLVLYALLYYYLDQVFAAPTPREWRFPFRRDFWRELRGQRRARGKRLQLLSS